MGFPVSSAGRESVCNAGDLGSIPGLGRSPGEGNGYPLQCSGLEDSMDYIVHGVTKSWTRLTDFHFTECYIKQLNMGEKDIFEKINLNTWEKLENESTFNLR